MQMGLTNEQGNHRGIVTQLSPGNWLGNIIGTNTQQMALN
jgi:hypothetical protein